MTSITIVTAYADFFKKEKQMIFVRISRQTSETKPEWLSACFLEVAAGIGSSL